MLTRPLIFSGDRLLINYATSAAGSLRVEVQDMGGRPFSGFSLSECREIIGNEIERRVTWEGRQDLGRLSGEAGSPALRPEGCGSLLHEVPVEAVSTDPGQVRHAGSGAPRLQAQYASVNPNQGGLLIHFPWVNSGKSTGALDRRIDCSERGEIAIQAAMS